MNKFRLKLAELYNLHVPYRIMSDSNKHQSHRQIKQSDGDLKSMCCIVRLYECVVIIHLFQNETTVPMLCNRYGKSRLP